MLSFFQAWYQSQFGLGQVLPFFFAWYLSQVRVCQVRFFFLGIVCRLTVKFVKYNRSVFTLYPNGSTTVVLWLYLYPHHPPPQYYTVFGQPLTFFLHKLFSQKETNVKSKENVRFCFEKSVLEEKQDKNLQFFSLLGSGPENCAYTLCSTKV